MSMDEDATDETPETPDYATQHWGWAEQRNTAVAAELEKAAQRCTVLAKAINDGDYVDPRSVFQLKGKIDIIVNPMRQVQNITERDTAIITQALGWDHFERPDATEVKGEEISGDKMGAEAEDWLKGLTDTTGTGAGA